MNDRPAAEDLAFDTRVVKKQKSIFHTYSPGISQLGALLLTNYVELRICKPLKSPDIISILGIFVSTSLKCAGKDEKKEEK